MAYETLVLLAGVPVTGYYALSQSTNFISYIDRSKQLLYSTIVSLFLSFTAYLLVIETSYLFSFTIFLSLLMLFSLSCRIFGDRIFKQKVREAFTKQLAQAEEMARVRAEKFERSSKIESSSDKQERERLLEEIERIDKELRKVENA